MVEKDNAKKIERFPLMPIRSFPNRFDRRHFRFIFRDFYFQYNSMSFLHRKQMINDAKIAVIEIYSR